MEGIKHESSHHGCVQSLTINKDGQDIAVCAILPGGYRLGPARRQLNLTVLSGRLFVNGKFYGRKDGSCTIMPARRSTSAPTRRLSSSATTSSPLLQGDPKKAAHHAAFKFINLTIYILNPLTLFKISSKFLTSPENSITYSGCLYPLG